jgi:arylsulfatase A
MNRRSWLSMTAAGMAQAAVSAQTPVRRPNVILVMSDDQGYGDLSCHGNRRLRTKNIDALAAQSIEFTRFYVSPVCAPTRASLLTGRYNLRAGVHGVTRGRETMRHNETTAAESFRAAGYRTGLVGKWHLGEHYPYVPHGQGFEDFVGFRTGHWNWYFDAHLEHNGNPLTSSGFITDVLTDEAIRFLERNQTNPFFLYVAYNAPHSPYQVPEKYYEQFKNSDLTEETKVVYGMISNLDENVGKLLSAVDRLGLADDTIFIFMTDNGPNGDRYNAGLRARKGSVYEGGVRVPFFIRWPKLWKQPRKIETIAAHIDIYPTLADLCGVTQAPGLAADGRSLRPLLEGKAEGWPDRMLFTHSDRERSQPYPGAVRTQRFNLVNGTELYDVSRDQGERTDVASSHPEVVKQLRSAYEAWYEEVSRECGFERLPIPVGYAEENPVVLPATQSYFDGSIGFENKNGYAHDWVSGWTRQVDRVWWEIDVVRSGTFDVSLRYACGEKDIGARIVVRAGDQAVNAEVRDSTSMTPLPNRNRVPSNHYIELDWATLKVGGLRLKKGRTRIVVEALSKPGNTVMELKDLRLRRR